MLEIIIYEILLMRRIFSDFPSPFCITKFPYVTQKKNQLKDVRTEKESLLTVELWVHLMQHPLDHILCPFFDSAGADAIRNQKWLLLALLSKAVW